LSPFGGNFSKHFSSFSHVFGDISAVFGLACSTTGKSNAEAVQKQKTQHKVG